MSYFAAQGGPARRTYVDTSRPLYGLGGMTLGGMTLGGVGQYVLRGLGTDPTPGTPPVAAEKPATPAAAEFWMPDGIRHLFLMPGGVPNAALAASFLAKFAGRMVDANGAFFQGIACDNVAGGTGPGQSVDATQVFRQWQAAGFFVVASTKAGYCNQAKGAYGQAEWIAYRVPKEEIGKLVGSSTEYVYGLPWAEPPTRASWEKYLPYVGKGGKGDTVTGMVTKAGMSGKGLIVGGAVLAAIFFATRDRY